METRLALEHDADILAPLHALCFTESPWSAEQLRTCLLLSTTRAWLTSYKNDPVGFIMCQSVGDESEILTLGVKPEARRHHIGQNLLDLAMASLFEEGIQRIFLEVAADNEGAVALYSKRAFNIKGRRKNYYKRRDSMADALTLEHTHSN